MKRFLCLVCLFMIFVLPMFAKDNITTIEGIPTITKNAKSIVKDTKKLSETYIIANIKKSNKMLVQTRKAVEGNTFFFFEKSDEKRIEAFVHGLENISSFYDSITKDKKVSDVKEELMANLKKTQKDISGLSSILESSRIEETQLTSNYEILKAQPSSKENLMKLESLNHQINYTKQQIDMVETYLNYYKEIEPAINSIDDKIDFFVLVLQEASKVYKKAYQTAKLALDINNMIDVISELTELTTLSSEIQNSWNDLDLILNNLVTLTEKSMIN